MKKTKLKNYLKLGIFLFGVSVFLINCERDYLEEIETENTRKLTVTIVDFYEVESNRKVFSKIESVINSKNEFAKNFRDTIVNNEYGFIIDTDYVKYVENGNYNSYNFEIIRDTPEDDKLENLFLTLNSDEEYDAFIVKYDFTAEELNSLTQEDLNNTTIQYTAIDFDTSFLSNVSARKTELSCESEWVWVPCSMDGDHGDGSGCDGGWSSEIVCSGGGGPGPGPNQDETSSGDITTGGNQGSGSSGGSNTGTDTSGSPPYSAPTCADCPELVEENPCSQLKNNSRSPDFIAKMNDLNTKSTTLNKEVGYIQKPDSAGTGIDYDYVEGDATTGMIVWDVLNTTTLKGMSHTHYDVENHYPVFSADDLFALFSLFGPVFDVSGNVTFSNPHNIGNNFTYILITAHGTKLALKFNDATSIEKFRLFGEKYFGDWDLATPPTILGVTPDTDRKKLLDKYKKITKKKFSIQKQKKKLAKFLDKNDLGFSLYQANDDFSEWEKINKTGASTPCD